MGLDKAVFKTAADLLELWGLEGVPCSLSEDGSAFQQRIDVTVMDQKVHVFGFSGNCFIITALQQLKKSVLAPTCHHHVCIHIGPTCQGCILFPCMCLCP
jgi:hypothetical protein